MNTSKVHAASLIKSHNLQIVISYMHTWQLFNMCHQELLYIANLTSPVATSSLSSTLDGRQAACPGEVVTYTCNVTQGFLIGWSAAPVLDAALVQFAPTDSRILGCSNVTAIQCDDFDFQATLTSVGPVQNGQADMSSTFRFTARPRLNGTVVECTRTTSPSTPSANQTLIIAG